MTPTTGTPSTSEEQQLLRRRRTSGAEVVAVGGVAAVGASFLFSPDHIEDGPVLCPFRALTGLPCPGCGLTRSWVYAAHGWWEQSFSSHPFGMLLVAAVLVLAVVVAVRRVRRIPPPDLDRVMRHPVALGIGAVWLVFAAVRLAYAL